MAGLNERDFLDALRRRVPAVGDDLAVLPSPAGKLLAGIDPVLDGVHVRLAEAGGLAAGRKAANRNLSDVAAMGGQPTALLLSLVASRDLSLDTALEIVDGVAEAATEADCVLVGGDFAVWDAPTAIVVAVLGTADQPVPRTGVRVGQQLFVTGPLGGSILGRHLTFTPRLTEGRRLADQADAIGLSVMMDLSDGLAGDLPKLLDGLGATLTHVPIHDDARQLDGDALQHALNDGEDYELLFAADRAPEGVDAIAIGTVDGGTGIRLQRRGASRGSEADSIEPARSAASAAASTDDVITIAPGGFVHGADVTTSTSVAQTHAVASRVAQRLERGGVLRLVGDLGAGKTTFVAGIVEALGGDRADVSSPTYVLHQTYPIADGRRLHHLDAYRVAGSDDFEAIGFGELLDDTRNGDVVVVEWPDRVAELLPSDAMTVEIEHLGEDARRISVR